MAGGKAIAAALANLRKAVESGSGLDAALGEIATIIWWPLRIDASATRIVISPDGGLEQVPFAALPATRDGPRQLERSEIVLIPSASLVAAIHRADAQYPRRIAVFADPVFSAADLRLAPANRGNPEESDPGRLRFSREEAAIIGKSAGADVTQWLDFDAVIGNFRRAAAEPAAILHLSTHAIVEDSDPAASRLVFSRFDANGKPQTADLRLNDIYNLRVRSGMVVLSACRAAAGPDVRGEGVLSLTRAFLYAGAKGVTATLWKVDDRAAAEFMGRFYQGLLKDRRAPADALRRAQLSMMKDARWRGIENWAAFVFTGDWSIAPWGQARER